MTEEDIQTHADAAIARGSQSFAAASRLFPAAMRRDVALLYAWCRHCDDEVDGQTLGHGRTERPGSAAERLDRLRRETEAALAGERAAQPAFAGLALVAARRGLPRQLPFDHLDGFRMDVDGERPRTIDDLLLYCYRVAGVVGVMMAHVMGARGAETLDRACDLGIAFQLTNIARDVVEDAHVGRIYLPLDWLQQAGVPAGSLAHASHRQAVAALAARLVSAAEPYYVSAGAGLADLPLRAAWAVGSARGIYRAIGSRVAERGAAAWDSRVRTGPAEKLGFVATAAFDALRSRVASPSPRPSGLWTRPELQMSLTHG